MIVKWISLSVAIEKWSESNQQKKLKEKSQLGVELFGRSLDVRIVESGVVLSTVQRRRVGAYETRSLLETVGKRGRCRFCVFE